MREKQELIMALDNLITSVIMMNDNQYIKVVLLLKEVKKKVEEIRPDN
jgi:hypothetical protein